jgi:hypothetical protein
MEKLERNHAAARQAQAHRNGPSGAEVMRGLLSPYAIDQIPGQSRAQTLARAAGISTSELKDLLHGQRVSGPGEVRHNESDRKGEISKMSKGIIYPKPAGLETGVNQRPAVPEIVDVQFVEADGRVVGSLLIEVDKSRAEPTDCSSKP